MRWRIRKLSNHLAIVLHNAYGNWFNGSQLAKKKNEKVHSLNVPAIKFIDKKQLV